MRLRHGNSIEAGTERRVAPKRYRFRSLKSMAVPGWFLLGKAVTYVNTQDAAGSDVSFSDPDNALPKVGEQPRLRMLALTLKPEGRSPGQRFRLEQWARYLAMDHGIDMEFRAFESPRLTEILYQRGNVVRKAFWVAHDFFRRAATVLSVRKYDAVVVYREAALIGPAIYERLIAWSGVPFLFDFDDAIWQQGPSPVNPIFSRLHFWAKTATTCKLAEVVVVGNSYLASYARRFNDRVAVIPTSIDLGRYHLKPEAAPDEPFTVCWTGSVTTLPLLEYARPALEQLARLRPLRVKVICNVPPATGIAGAENVFIPWEEQGEPEEIADCHVGIMPLPEDIYMAGKCGLKALQFMAVGRPVVISPVGMNKELIHGGENGFLATSEDEWVGCLSRLAESPELRKRMGLAGRRLVEKGYSAPDAAALFSDAVRCATRGRARRHGKAAWSAPR
jgi:glycosyltransferase involved in cell wall biosynthesis